MADVFTVVFSVLAVFVALPAFWLVASALFPRASVQSQRRFAHTPYRTVPAGLALSLVTLGPAIGLMNLPWGPVKLVGVWVLSLTIGLSLTGLGGLARHVGASLASPADEGRSWRQILKGGFALEAACLIPVFGWFFLIPLLLTAGLGAGGLAIIRRLPEPTGDAEEAPQTPTLRAVGDEA